jgi:hypothetical protein
MGMIELLLEVTLGMDPPFPPSYLPPSYSLALPPLSFLPPTAFLSPPSLPSPPPYPHLTSSLTLHPGEKERRNVEQLITNMDLLNALLEDMITYSRADSGLITLDMSTWRREEGEGEGEGGGEKGRGEGGGRRREEGKGGDGRTVTNMDPCISPWI